MLIFSTYGSYYNNSETLQESYESGDQDKFLAAQKNLEVTIKKMAKDIRDKYIDPPNTTDFAIMFLPFEGIYSEVVKKASLLEELQKDLNAWLEEYNMQRTHTGKYCYGKTPMETFLDSIELAKSKMLDQLVE